LVGAPFDRSRLVRAFGNFGKGKFKMKD